MEPLQVHARACDQGSDQRRRYGRDDRALGRLSSMNHEPDKVGGQQRFGDGSGDKPEGDAGAAALLPLDLRPAGPDLPATLAVAALKPNRDREEAGPK